MTDEKWCRCYERPLAELRRHRRGRAFRRAFMFAIFVGGVAFAEYLVMTL